MQAFQVSLRGRQVHRVHRLKREAERDGAYRVAKRLHAVLLSGDGMTAPQIASTLKVHRSNVSLWLRHWQAHGLDGLLEGHREGRPQFLNGKQRGQLADIVDSGPVAYGFPSGVWTSPMIAAVIEDEFGVAYHPGHVRKLLAHLGFSVQRPRRHLAQADPHAQNRWRRYTFPRLKKNHRRRRPSDF